MCIKCIGWDCKNGGCMLHNTIQVGCNDFCEVQKTHVDCYCEWIPCNERLPEFGITSYLVCLKNGGIFIAIFLNDGEFKEISSLGIRKFSENNPVIAWQPLPNPYTESKD